MLAVYRSGRGTTRRELHRSIENILSAAEDCDRRRVAAFCKLLDDRSEFETDHRGAAADLRLRVFSLAAQHHPLSSFGDHARKSQIASHVSLSPGDLDRLLYADVIDFQPLTRFLGYPSAESLLSRYNVAQLQACLYRAKFVSILATADFKAILRYARLARLMHDIRRLGPGRYQIDLSGPASVLHQTRRYGGNFARFISGLLACRGWEMHAELHTRWGGTAKFFLCSGDGYHSHLDAPEPFDSSVEEAFAAGFGPSREGWELLREDVILHDGQLTFVPDFVLRHACGEEILLEIVGFWTPDYLERKRRTLLRFSGHRILVAVAERNRRDETKPLRPPFISYRKQLDPELVLRSLRAYRA